MGAFLPSADFFAPLFDCPPVIEEVMAINHGTDHEKCNE